MIDKKNRAETKIRAIGRLKSANSSLDARQKKQTWSSGVPGAGDYLKKEIPEEGNPIDLELKLEYTRQYDKKRNYHLDLKK